MDFVLNEYHRNISDEDLINDVLRVAKLCNNEKLSQSNYEEWGKYSCRTVEKRFGGWNRVMKTIGLSVNTHTVSDEELFQEIERVWITLGKQPTMTDIRNGKFSHGSSTFIRHFGSWRGALEAFVRYINSDDNVLPASDSTIDLTETHFTSIINKDVHKTNRDINLRLRFKVMQRDNFKCCICGKSPATSPNVTLHIDHIKPWSKGGKTTIDNLQTLCSECNYGKSDLYEE